MKVHLLWATLTATAAFADDVPDLTTARQLSGVPALGWVGVALAFLAICAALSVRARNSSHKETTG